MARKKRKKSELLEVAKNMPMNFHRLPGMGYDPDKSKVLDGLQINPNCSSGFSSSYARPATSSMTLNGKHGTVSILERRRMSLYDG